MPERVEVEEWKHEELADAERYDKMAKEYPALAKLFEYMAADERAHAHMMDVILMKYN